MKEDRWAGGHSAAAASGLADRVWVCGSPALSLAANGGSLHAQSRGPGLGTTMSMRLPTVSAETPELLEALDG
jgi:hypothetical protein